jgi:hypothetical protein
MLPYGAAGVYPSPRGLPSNVWTLQAGAARLIPPGTWNLALGPYSALQEYDTVQGQWVNCGGTDTTLRSVNSDGNNYRAVNQQGCVVGVSVTTAGSSYTSAPTVVTSAGSATLTALVGGAVSTTVTISNAGAGYNYPPLIFLDPPPTGAGLQATGYSTLSTNTVSTITIDNQGAGYTNVPNVYIIPDPRDTGPTTPAAAVAALTGSQTVTGVLVTNYGTPLTTIPTLTWSGGGGSSAAGTVIMVRSIGAYVVSSGGSGYSGTVIVSAVGNGGVASPANTNPKWTTNLVRTRAAVIVGALGTSGGLSATGQTVIDGGIYGASSPTAVIYGTLQTNTGNVIGAVTFTWANNNDTIQLLPT